MIINIVYNVCVLLVVKEILRENYDIFYININDPGYKSFVFTVIYNYLYYYSKIEIFIKNARTSLIQIKEPISSFIELYKDGNSVIKQNYNESFLTDLKDIDYNYAVYSGHDTKLFNKVLYKILPEKIEYEVSNIKFISLNVEYNNTIYEIELQKPEYNYYIVNNTIDNMFIMYYLKNVIKTNVTDSLNELTYKLTLMDNNANIGSLNESCILIIEKDNYIVKKE